jgi:S-methylmethionine-dependent homocysteine/selenocysteine methylase
MLTHESRFLGILISHEYNQSPLHNINLNMNKLLGLNAIQSYHELQARVAHHEIRKPWWLSFILEE